MQTEPQTYALAKTGLAGSRFYVTRIIDGGYRIDLCRVERPADLWGVLGFRTTDAAEAALAAMRFNGGYDGYAVVAL